MFGAPVGERVAAALEKIVALTWATSALAVLPAVTYAASKMTGSSLPSRVRIWTLDVSSEIWFFSVPSAPNVATRTEHATRKAASALANDRSS